MWKPHLAPVGARIRCRWRTDFGRWLRAGWIIGIILVTIGGIYLGVFSAVEAAGIGAFLAFLSRS